MSEPQDELGASRPPKKRRSILMTALKVVLLLVVVAVAVFFLVGYFVLDGKYDLARETTIKAPPEAVHQQVGDLRQWPNWLPFTKHDSSIVTTIHKPTGVGAHQTWTGDHGKGELTFTSSDEQKGIEFKMLFDEKYASTGSLTYSKVGDDTRVTWRMTGQNDDLIGRWMVLAMRRMMGPMFDEGLADLKAKVEAK
jgi:hypothetical protein